MINWFLNLGFIYQLLLTFSFGFFIGILLMFIIINVKDKKLSIYKRQLEKESISSDENEAKIKVLESKIQVLEKALENALNS